MHWLRGSVGCTNRPATSLLQPSSTPFHGMVHDLRALEARRGRHVQALGRAEVDAFGGARGRPRARAALGPPPPAEGGRDTRPIAGYRRLQRHDRPPARAAVAVVVGAVDAVEDPPPRSEPGISPISSPTSESSGSSARTSRSIAFSTRVGDRHRRAVALGRQPQLVRAEVAHRDAVGLVCQPVCEEEVRREVAHCASLPRGTSIVPARGSIARWGRHRHRSATATRSLHPPQGDQDVVDRERPVRAVRGREPDLLPGRQGLGRARATVREVLRGRAQGEAERGAGGHPVVHGDGHAVGGGRADDDPDALEVVGRRRRRRTPGPPSRRPPRRPSSAPRRVAPRDPRPPRRRPWAGRPP